MRHVREQIVKCALCRTRHRIDQTVHIYKGRSARRDGVAQKLYELAVAAG